ncbi:MAG: integrase arm-type DNA-binding domain-containing protein, partial [Deferribacteraceae bacterium]|nr:integrase arm-type DNA-binding domain-containing protein [Deferribacteraceae bacterium]
MSLTEIEVKTAKIKEADYKISDGHGMYLHVTKSGSKYFRFAYRFAGKQKTLALGVYPQTSLKVARERCNEAKKLLSEKIDPSEVRKATKHNIYSNTNNTFEALAKEWYDTAKPKWTEKYANAKWDRLEKYVLPYLGSRPIKNITVQELLSVIRMIETRGIIETSHLTRSVVSEVFAFAIATARADRNIAHDLKGVALIPVVRKNMPTITNPQEVGILLNVMDGYKGDFITRCALKLTPYVMLRPRELRSAEWSEIDLVNRQWKIPAEKMKMRRPHIIPLSRQALEILQELHFVTGKWKYVFPCVRSKHTFMSKVTMNAALRRMGY